MLSTKELHWVIIAVLAAYCVYVPYIPYLTPFYKTDLGKFVVLGSVALAHQSCPLMSVFLAIAFVRLLTYTGYEHFDTPPPTTTPPVSSPPTSRPLSERPTSGVPSEGETRPPSTVTSRVPSPRMSSNHENSGVATL